MKTSLKVSVVIIFLFLTSILGFAQQASPAPAQGPPPGPPVYSIPVTSSSFEDGAIMPVKHTQAAATVPPSGGASPQFSWSAFPTATQTFVLYMHDLDVVRNKSMEDNTHWIVWNIPVTTTSLQENLQNAAMLPDGSQQQSNRGPVYAGPGAPAAGPLHHYIFELLALDIKLDITPGANVAETRDKIFEAIKGHILARGIYVGRAKRPQ